MYCVDNLWALAVSRNLPLFACTIKLAFFYESEWLSANNTFLLPAVSFILTLIRSTSLIAAIFWVIITSVG
jgi:hypothetical protein